jgi:hypothetical protein
MIGSQGITECNRNPAYTMLTYMYGGYTTTVTAAGFGVGTARVRCAGSFCEPWPAAIVQNGALVDLHTRKVIVATPAAASCPPTLTGRRSTGLTNRGAMLLTLYLTNPQTGQRTPISGWIDTGAMMTVVAHGEGPAVGLQPHWLSMGMQGVDGAPTASHTYTADLQTAAGYTVSRGPMDVSSASLPAAGWGLTPTTLLLGQSFLRNWTLVEAATTWSLSPNWCAPTTTENVD